MAPRRRSISAGLASFLSWLHPRDCSEVGGPRSLGGSAMVARMRREVRRPGTAPST